MKYDLSVIIPSIRVQNLEKIYFMLENACAPYSWELIIVSPEEQKEVLKSKDNVKWIRDLGCPSRCVQMGSALSEAKFMAWMADDCTFVTPQSLAQCIDLLETQQDINNAVCLRYFEGETGFGEFPIEYWNAKYHGDQKDLVGIKDNFKLAPLAIYFTKYFREIGGLDCRYEHINMCTHDLAFRLQNSGGKILMSPQTVARFYWSWITADAKPVQRAYFENDLKYFQTMWNQDQSSRININYWNWIEVPQKWVRRFG